MEPVNQDLQGRIEDAVKNIPQLKANFEHLLKVKKEDLDRFKELFSKPELPGTVETHQFFDHLLSYFPKEARLAPWASLINIWFMSQQFNIQPEQILKVLRDLYAEGSDIQHIFNLLDSLQNANQRITSSAKQVWYATRNNRFLNSVVTASDLRVVYKEDFSPAVEKSMYDPFLDFETLVPVARIRLAFDISGLDFVDFTCDMNNLKTLMHSLELTYKQLEMLQELAGTLERETKNEQPDS